MIYLFRYLLAKLQKNVLIMMVINHDKVQITSTVLDPNPGDKTYVVIIT